MSGSQAPSSSPSSFQQRRLDVTIQLGQGKFGESGFDTVKLSGLRVIATVTNAGASAKGECHMRVYGMPLSLMNQLSTLGMSVFSTRRNSVLLEASTDSGGMATVYQGDIVNAWADFAAAPDVCFELHGVVGDLNSIKPVPPSSFKGAADVATIMAALAKQMGYAFENNGVSVKLSNPYYPGTAWWQMQACAKDANINVTVERGTVAIWPKDGSRGGPIPLISPQTGMVSYPTFNANGLLLQTLYNPDFRHGALVKVQSSLTPACGVWGIYSLTHDLASELPGGPWFTHIAVVAPQLLVG